MKRRHGIGKRITTLFLAAAMLLGLVCTSAGRTYAASATGPVVHDNKDGTYDVTLSYQSSASSVELRGTLPGVGWGGVAMEKGADNVWTKTVRITEPGAYCYKFYDGNWHQDPNNSFTGSDDGNSFIAVGYEGLEIDGTSVTFKYINKDSGNPTIEIAGTMTGWTAQSMNNKGDGVYTYTLSELDPGKYEYKFVIGGKWVADPTNSLPLVGNNANSQFTIEEPKPDPTPPPTPEPTPPRRSTGTTSRSGMRTKLQRASC